jgi:hypothetical protein
LSGKVIAIHRLSPRDGISETPAWTSKGFQLADPALGSEKHKVKHATYARTLDEAATYISKGFSMWMQRPGKRASLICPASLDIIRD